MREIKFRGKRIDSGEWVYGNLVTTKDSTYICYKNQYNDDLFISPSNIMIGSLSETIGQYTGLHDKNGAQIYEGDILRFCDVGEEGYEYKEGFDFENVARVVYENGRFELADFLDSNSGVADEMYRCHEDFIHVFKQSKVIGNIYDNPELIA